MCQFGLETECTLTEAWNMTLKAKKLVRGSFIILCTPGKRKDLGGCFSLFAPLPCNLKQLEAKK